MASRVNSQPIFQADHGRDSSQSSRKRPCPARNVWALDLGYCLYALPPACDVTLEDFSTLGADRLNLFRCLTQDVKDICNVESCNLLHPQTPKDVRRDTLSHYILQLAFCGTEHLRGYLMASECSLLKKRFATMPPGQWRLWIESYMRQKGLDCELHPLSTYENILPYSWLEKYKHVDEETTDLAGVVRVYKVPFPLVSTLVASRAVSVTKGFAMVPEHLVVELMLRDLKVNVEKWLTVYERVQTTANDTNAFMEDERLLPVLSHLRNLASGQVTVSESNRLSGLRVRLRPEQIDEIAGEHFPLCMQYLHSGLRKNHHLRYYGRVQYGLFLKSAGFTLHESLNFWKEAFLEKMTEAQYKAKRYEYNIRYDYGKEGRRKESKGFSCHSILKLPAPRTGDHHGCPFVHWDRDALENWIARDGALRPEAHGGWQEVLDLASTGDYPSACTKHLMWSRGVEMENLGWTVTHPNDYLDESVAMSSA